MVSPDAKIEPTRDRESVRSQDSASRRQKIPDRDFREVVEQVDERRYREKEDDKTNASKKRATAGSKSSALGKDAPLDHPPTIFELARGYKEQQHSPKKEDANAELMAKSAQAKKGFKDSEREPSPFAFDSLKEKKTESRFGALEQPDLAAVNPAAAALQPIYNISAQKTEGPALSTRSMQEIIDQIVKEVYTLEESGRSETVISLKGAFEGSRLIISQFDSAHREMNITIDNLKSGAVKDLLDAHKNELINKLANEQNIVVHMFTATTTMETTRFDGAQSDQGQNSFAKDSEGHESQRDTEGEESSNG